MSKDKTDASGLYRPQTTKIEHNPYHGVSIEHAPSNEQRTADALERIADALGKLCATQNEERE